MDSNVTKYQVKEELHRQWGAQAVDLALNGNWDEAVQLNLRILENYSTDIHARNRLGKAYYELGRYEEALQAYEESLKAQPSNNIARKRLAELYATLQREPAFALGETMPGVEIAEADGDELDDLETYFEEDEGDGGADDEGDSD